MNELEKHTLELIGEDPNSPDVFTDTSEGMAQIRDSLNDAIEEISMITGATKRNHILLLRSGVIFYRLNYSKDQFCWVTDAWLRTINRRLQHTDMEALKKYDPGWMTTSATPTHYFPIGVDVVGFHPKPADDNLLVELTTVIIPERYINDDERIRLKPSFKWAAVHFAVGEYYVSRGDAKQALYHHGQYMEKLGIQGLYPLTQEKRWQRKTSELGRSDNKA